MNIIIKYQDKITNKKYKIKIPNKILNETTSKIEKFFEEILDYKKNNKKYESVFDYFDENFTITRTIPRLSNEHITLTDIDCFINHLNITYKSDVINHIEDVLEKYSIQEIKNMDIVFTNNSELHQKLLEKLATYTFSENKFYEIINFDKLKEILKKNNLIIENKKEDYTLLL